MADFPQDPQVQPERTVSLHEGSQSRQVPWLLSPNQAVTVENLEIDEIGVRTRRRGARAFGGIHDTQNPGGVASYNDADFDEFLIALWGNSAYKSTGNGGWDAIACDVSLLPGMLHDFARARSSGELSIAWAQCERPTETSLGISGRSQLVVYGIETDVATQVSLAPRAIAAFQNRLFYGEAETVGWSSIGELADFTDASSILIDPGVGGEITALAASRDTEPKLLILKEKAIYVFSPRWGQGTGAFIPGAGDALDTLSSSVRPLTIGTGCVATKTFQPVPDAEGADSYFLAPDGVRSLNRAENDVAVGAGFPLTHNVPSFINRINFTAAHRATASVHDNAYHLAVPMDGALDNSHVLRYDIINKAWSLHTWEMKDVGTFRLGGEDRLFGQCQFQTLDTSSTDAAGDSAFQLYQLYSGDHDPSTDATEVIRPVFQEISRAYAFGDPQRQKRYDRFVMKVSSTDTAIAEVAFRRDLGSWNTLTELYIDGSGGTIVFGQELLPWESSDEALQYKSLTIKDLAQPSHLIQFRIGGVTGSTESGRPSVYLTEVQAAIATERFENGS